MGATFLLTPTCPHLQIGIHNCASHHPMDPSPSPSPSSDTRLGMAEAAALFSLSAAVVVEDVLRQHGRLLSNRDLMSRSVKEAAVRRNEATGWHRSVEIQREFEAIGLWQVLHRMNFDSFRRSQSMNEGKAPFEEVGFNGDSYLDYGDLSTSHPL